MDRLDYIFENDPNDSEGWVSDVFYQANFAVPLGDVDDIPAHCVTISREWLPFIAGAIERLRYGDMWDATPEEMEHIDRNIGLLQAMWGMDLCEGGPNDYSCQDIPLHSPIIDWLPADPFHDPSGIPAGYSLPPFVVAEFDEPVNGIKAGDVVIGVIGSLIAFPPVVPVSGVPRFQLHVQGPAEVDIDFVEVFQGGMAVVFVDGVPNHWVDLQKYSVFDILNVTSWFEIFGFFIDNFTSPSLQDSIVCSEDREYIIEVQFFPRPALDYTLGYGGGVRSIQICSVEEQIDLSGVVQDIRINNGTIEKFVEGLWSGVDVEDGNDVITENELRANGCQLQAYDLQSGTWVDVTDAAFYRRDVACDLLHNIRIVTGQDGYHIGMNSATATNAAMMGAFGNTAYLRGVDNVVMINGSNMALSLNGADYGYVKDAGGGAPNYGMFNIVASGTKVPLSVMSQNSTPIALQRWYDHQSRILAEVSPEGRLQAIEDLDLYGFSNSGAKQLQAYVRSLWTEATDAIRKSRVTIAAADNTGGREGLRVEGDGSSARLGFFGSSAVNRPVMTGTDMAAILTELLVGFDQLGLIDNQTAFGAGNPLEEALSTETHFETYWDLTDVEPVGNDIGLVVGVYTADEGFREDALGLKDGVHISRQIDEYSGVIAYKVQFQVANLSGGNVTLLALFEVADPDEILFADSYTDGIYQVTIPVGMSSEGERVDIKIYTDDNETADIAIQGFWELGLGLPPFDRHHKPTERAVHTDIATGWTLPTT